MDRRKREEKIGAIFSLIIEGLLSLFDRNGFLTHCSLSPHLIRHDMILINHIHHPENMYNLNL